MTKLAYALPHSQSWRLPRKIEELGVRGRRPGIYRDRDFAPHDEFAHYGEHNRRVHRGRYVRRQII